MRIRLGAGTRMAGPEGNYGPGDTVEVTTAVGEMLIANWLAAAVEVAAVAQVETADNPPPETATAPPQRRRTRKT